MGTVLSENHQRLQDRERELKDMKRVLDTLTRSSVAVRDETESILSELQESIQRMLDLTQDVMLSSGQEKLNEAQDLVTKLEAEVSQLKRKDGELKEIINCPDNIHFLKTYQTLCCPLDAGEVGTVCINPEASFDSIRSIMIQFREKVEEMSDQELDKINKMVFNTTGFTVMDRNGQKTGFMKWEQNSSYTRTPPTPITIRSHSSMRPRETPRRETPRETSDADAWTLSSVRSRGRGRADDREQEADRPASQRRQSTQTRKPQEVEQENGKAQSVPNTADRQQPTRQSDRWSLTSLLPRNRKKRQDPVNDATPTIPEVVSERPRSLSSASAWGEPTEVNTALFLDSPTDNPFINPDFPTLREINIDSIQAAEPRTRDEFLQYACDLTLDPLTAHRRIQVSDDACVATLQTTSQECADLPQRFDGWTQLLCLQPLTSTRCYWEVEWRGQGSSMGVACGSMARKGTGAEAGLGYNSQSWSLELSDMCCTAMHANQKVEIPVTYSPRVGVFLDRTAGTLSFYSVDDELVPLHRFQGEFPQTLFAAFGVGCGVGVGLNFAMGQFTSSSDSIKICSL
ncbi:hypothetical protein DNTS_010268 [Danionella cerebrum]|uniref:B30.2/SPRY domain-containing protein n=1 Tax=Danionella cerebrum TaxID=2873325 RepID=A0A553R954_9TELE|nr:hypothetical protein DNTS_010268 [Danionella translucida]